MWQQVARRFFTNNGQVQRYVQPQNVGRHAATDKIKAKPSFVLSMLMLSAVGWCLSRYPVSNADKSKGKN